MRTEIILSPTPPYDFDLSFSYLGPHRPDPIARFNGTTFSRIWSLGSDADALISLKSLGSLNRPKILLTIEGENLVDEDIDRCVEQIEKAFCLHLDLDAFYREIERDSTLRQHCLNNIGLKPVLEPSIFEALTWAIIGQQVNLRFACQVKEGMLKKFARSVTFNDHLYYRYPTAEELAGRDPLEWREFKCSLRKAEYIIGLAELVQSGFDLVGLGDLPDEEIVERLVQIRGIGRWTADYALIRGLGRFDALPTGDAGLLNGYKNVYNLQVKPDPEELVKRAESWRPYRGLATYYLWWGIRS